MRAFHPPAWSQLHKAAWAQTPQHHQMRHRPEEAGEAEAVVEVDEAAEEAAANRAVDEERP